MIQVYIYATNIIHIDIKISNLVFIKALSLEDTNNPIYKDPTAATNDTTVNPELKDIGTASPSSVINTIEPIPIK